MTLIDQAVRFRPLSGLTHEQLCTALDREVIPILGSLRGVMNANTGTGLSPGTADYVLQTDSTGLLLEWGLTANANVALDAAIAVTKLAAGSNGDLLHTTGGVPAWGTIDAATSIDPGAAYEVLQTDAAASAVEWTGTIRMDDGSVAAPSHSFASNVGDGFYLIGAANAALALGGTKKVDYAATAIGYSDSGGSTIVSLVDSIAVIGVPGFVGVTGSGTGTGGHIGQVGGTGGATDGTGGQALLVGGGGGGSNGPGGLTTVGGGIGVGSGAHGLVNVAVGGLTQAQFGLASVDFQDNLLITTGDVSIGATPATAGDERVPHGHQKLGRNNANAADWGIFEWGVAGTDILRVGDQNNAETRLTSATKVDVNIAGGLEHSFTATAADFQTNIVTSSGVFLMGDGAVGGPGWSFHDETDTGLYRIGADNIGMALGGTLEYDFSATALDIKSNNLTTTGTVNADTSFTSAGFIALGADPADTGAVRLSNNTGVYGEKATPGTDLLIVSIRSDDQVQLGSGSNSGVVLGAGSTGYAFFAGGSQQFVLNTTLANFQDNDIQTTGETRTGDGLVGSPGFAFQSDATDGFYEIGAADVGLALAGALEYEWDATTFDAKSNNITTTGTVHGLKVTTRVTGALTLTAAHHTVFANTDGGTYAITLPAVAQGREYRIINSGSSTVALTITPNGSDHLIGVNSNYTLLDGEVLILTGDTTDGWY